ncbi:uncharacterized protein LOC134260853 isoform X2 [Saccostrea cucullata]
MKSGSRREGFRMITSDLDTMAWRPDHKVICDLSQISLYHILQHTVILMECDDLPPGFTRLNLLSPTNSSFIMSACLVKNNELYISSTLFRNNHLQFIKTIDGLFASSIPHGPCSSNVIEEDFEADLVLCFHSNHWPTIALPWIHRCLQQGWPSRSVLSNILCNGFHVVPIGSKPENEDEWRISFSQAEKKLVCEMNHSQFLCYGLLKILLKEVINSQLNSPVLCSYFVKTILFWVIQNNKSLIWTPNCLLSCFWKCFKLLIYWVRIGECPNFFIPQNNMFRLKVTGSVQASLFYQLQDLYHKGIPCLLLSQTLRPYLSQAILYRSLRVCTDESSIKTSTELDISVFEEIRLLEYYQSIEDFPVYMKQVERLMRQNLTSHQVVTLQCMTSSLLRNSSLSIRNGIDPNKNRAVYCNICNVTAMLKLSCTTGFVSDILYLAMYFYRTRRYEDSLNCLQKAQERMSAPFIMYRNNVNIDMYEYYTSGMSLGMKIKRAVMVNIKLTFKAIYIDELELEQKIKQKEGMGALYVPPLVILHMLFVLNHHRLGDTVRSQQSLQDLQTLLLYDDGDNVSTCERDISWQILGICQQITGDYSESLRSYQNSLQQYPVHRIQDATLLRLNTLPRGTI